MIGPAPVLSWLVATVVEIRLETPTAKTIAFDVPGWTGHAAGQHLDIRLTAGDGYQAERSYSIASAAGAGTRIELTVELVENGEVSSFLLNELIIGDRIELRGPIGDYFSLRPDSSVPLLLIGGGSGIVPLMSMLRTRAAGPVACTNLIYSARSLNRLFYQTEIDHLVASHTGLAVTYTLTRSAPPDWPGQRGRIGRVMLRRRGIEAAKKPDIFVCGPTLFVESVAEQLVAEGHAEAAIRTERFGPTGEQAK